MSSPRTRLRWSVRRKHYASSSASTCIGPVLLAPEDDSWKRVTQYKRAMRRKDSRVAPGAARRAWMRGWRNKSWPARK
eukprot:9724839-Lingulodinium_polyedra.AAC.1